MRDIHTDSYIIPTNSKILIQDPDIFSPTVSNIVATVFFLPTYHLWHWQFLADISIYQKCISSVAVVNSRYRVNRAS